MRTKAEVTLWILANTNSTGRHDGFNLQVSEDRNLCYLPRGITRLHEWSCHLSTSSGKKREMSSFWLLWKIKMQVQNYIIKPDNFSGLRSYLSRGRNRSWRGATGPGRADSGRHLSSPLVIGPQGLLSPSGGWYSPPPSIPQPSQSQRRVIACGR